MAGSSDASSAAAAGSSAAASATTILPGSGYGVLKRRAKESAYIAGKTLTRRTLVQIVDLYSIDLPTLLTDVTAISRSPDYARIVAQAMAPAADSAAATSASPGDATAAGASSAAPAAIQSWTHQHHTDVLDALVRRYAANFDLSADGEIEAGMDAFGVIEDAAAASGVVTVAMKGSSTVYPLNAAAVARLLAAVPSTAAPAAASASASSSSAAASSSSGGGTGSYDETDGWLSLHFMQRLRAVLSLYACYLIAREFPAPDGATASVNGLAVSDKESEKLEELTRHVTGQRAGRRQSTADAGAKPAKRAARARSADHADTDGDASEGAPKRGRKKKAAEAAPVVDPAALAPAAPAAATELVAAQQFLAGLYAPPVDPYGLPGYMAMPAAMPAAMMMPQYPHLAAAAASGHPALIPPPHSTAPPLADEDLESAFV